MEQRPICLSIGGSDSCGGAGIQADLRVFEALNTHGCSAITALTAQNPATVARIEAVPLAQLDAELHAVFNYYDVAAVKTGMLLDAEHVAVISAVLSLFHAGKPLVIDPVMVSSSGVELLDPGGQAAMLNGLLPMAMLFTPNLDEAAVLLGRSVNDAETDAQQLMQMLNCNILLKGGHAEGEILRDVLCLTDARVVNIEHPRKAWNTERAHGSGCRLAAAIAALLAQGAKLEESVLRAIDMTTD